MTGRGEAAERMIQTMSNFYRHSLAADPTADFVTTTTNYAHSIGNIVTGAAAAGLRIDLLEEHDWSEINPRGDSVLQRGDDGLWRLLLGRGKEEGSTPEPMPVYFTLLATKA